MKGELIRHCVQYFTNKLTIYSFLITTNSLAQRDARYNNEQIKYTSCLRNPTNTGRRWTGSKLYSAPHQQILGLYFNKHRKH